MAGSPAFLSCPVSPESWQVIGMHLFYADLFQMFPQAFAIAVIYFFQLKKGTMETKTGVRTGQAIQQVDPMKIMNTGMGFFSSKTLLTAVKLNLFTILSKGSFIP